MGEEKEEEIVISTVAVGDSDLKNLTCPVCGDEFGQFYKQSGEGEEEGWYLHNAMKAEDGTIYHPECYKDRAQALDTSADADTTVDNETTIETPATETTEEVVTKQEPTEEEDENKPSEVVINPPSEASGVIEEGSIKKEEPEAQDDQCNNGDANEDSTMDPPKETSPEPMEESEVKTEELTDDGVKEEEGEESGNTSLVTDEHMQLAAPIMPQPKVEIKVTINSTMKQVERMDSTISGGDEDSEFDKDAIITKKVDQEVLDAQKPRMKGKRFTEWPEKKSDKDLSGLCSIM